MICPNCQQKFNYFKQDFNKERNGEKGFPCPQCGTRLRLGPGSKRQIKILLAVFTAIIYASSFFLSKIIKWGEVYAVIYPSIFAVFIYLFYRATESATGEAVIGNQSPAATPVPKSQPITEVQADGFKVNLGPSATPSPIPGAYQMVISLAAVAILFFIVLSNMFKDPVAQPRANYSSPINEKDPIGFLRDSDSDGLLDTEEDVKYNTNQNDADTDKDGLTDYEEIKIYGSDPLKVDTDADGQLDGTEATAGNHPAGEGIFNPFATPEKSLHYMEHAIAKGNLDAYESAFYYPDSFIKGFIGPNFGTDLSGFKRRFKNKVFAGMPKDNVGAVVISKREEIDKENVAIEYYRFTIENRNRGIGNPDKTYFKKIGDLWLVDIEKEFTVLKETNPEGWQLNAKVYSTE